MLIIIFLIHVPQVVDDKLLMNPNISYQLQDIFNLLSDVTNPVIVHSLQVETNDQMLAMYIASVIRSVIDLLNTFEHVPTDYIKVVLF